MGLDVGTKYIGVAVSDESGILAQGRETVLRKSDEYVVEQFKKKVEEENVIEIVVGLPLNMNGSEGPRAKDSIQFAEMLKQQLNLSVELWDERLSTTEGEDLLISASVRRNKRKKVIDKIAAQIILQGYLDWKRREDSDSDEMLGSGY